MNFRGSVKSQDFEKYEFLRFLEKRPLKCSIVQKIVIEILIEIVIEFVRRGSTVQKIVIEH